MIGVLLQARKAPKGDLIHRSEDVVRSKNKELTGQLAGPHQIQHSIAR